MSDIFFQLNSEQVMSEDSFYSKFSSEDEEFYALTLIGKEGRIIWATQSRWAGFTDTKPLKELRVPRKVYPRIGKLWTEIGQPFVVIRSPEQMISFLMSGGNALVEPELFEAGFGEFLEPEISIPDGAMGFSAPSFYDNSAFRRVPAPKLRMQILNRDKKRCRICGRRPDDHLDLELHVHHIRPWAVGGVTDEKNLITLCSTCHNGLDPHYDMSLFGYTDPKLMSGAATNAATDHMDGVIEYRRIVRTNEVRE